MPVFLFPRLYKRVVQAVSQHADFVKDTDPEQYAAAKIIASMLERGLFLNKLETEFLRLIILEWLDNLDPDEYDEALELAYYKMYGEWAITPPYFAKRDGLPWPPPWESKSD